MRQGRYGWVMKHAWLVLAAIVVQISGLAGCAQVEPVARIAWRSAVLERNLLIETSMPKAATTRPASVPAVIVLRNLPTSRATPQVRDKANTLLRDAGNAILFIDYSNECDATNDAMVRDLLKLRLDIKEKTLDLDPAIDVNRIWILPEGYALRRDVTFLSNEQKTWQLDIAYPIEPARHVSTLMEITCDNASRMGNFSLVYCRDTLLEGALLRGFAAAMIDHPVPAPYKGIDDPMPELIHRLKAAVRTIRAQADSLPLNGQIGAMGFSRGGPMAAFLAVTNDRPEFDIGGEHPAASSNVQAALIHGNRYDYSDLSKDDPMLPRFEKAWGPRAANEETWLRHGAAYYLLDRAVPMYLNTSQAESVEFRSGLERLHQVLTARSIPHEYVVDEDARGHQVSTDPKRLSAIYSFFAKELSK